MKEIFKRLRLPTPDEWRRFRNWMAFFTASFIGVIAIGEQYLPDWAVWFSQHAIAATALAGIVAQATVFDSDKPLL